MSLRAFFIFTSLGSVAGKVEDTGRTVRFGLITKWMSALADNSCLGRLFRRVCEPAETRENAEEPAVFYLSLINAKNLGESSKRSREILWEIVSQTLENRSLDRFCEAGTDCRFRCSIAVCFRKQLLILSRSQLAIGNPRD